MARWMFVYWEVQKKLAPSISLVIAGRLIGGCDKGSSWWKNSRGLWTQLAEVLLVAWVWLGSVFEGLAV